MLEVAHERNVRRIAAEVVERPRGSLFLAVGRSADVRAAVEAALEERGLAVARVMLHEGEAPWRRIVAAAKLEEGAGSKVLLSVAGLGDMAEEKLDLILQHLNLGRELRVINRLHVLLWVGGLDRLDRFRTGASDLWGHRSSVELFLSSEDFEVARADVEPGEVRKDIETLLRETEVELALAPGARRLIELHTNSAYYSNELGRLDAAAHAVENAEGILAKSAMSLRDAADALSYVVMRKLSVLRVAGRTEDALTYAASIPHGPDNDPLLRYVVDYELAALHGASGRITETMACIVEALDLGPDLRIRTSGGQGRILVARANQFARLGALDHAEQDAMAASKEVNRVGERSDSDDAVRLGILSHADWTLAQVSLERGGTLRALEHAHRSATRIVGLAAKHRVRTALSLVAETYRRLGLLGDARSFACRAIELLEHSPGDVAWWTSWLGARDADEQHLDAAIAGYESAVARYKAAAATEHSPHRRASWLRDAASVLYENLAPLADAATAARHFAAAEDLLARASLAATEAASPEQHALTQRSRAFLAAARKQWDLAETELLAFLAWAEANWGPYKRAEVLLDLARVTRERGDLPRAATYAERAQHEVAIDPPEYRNRFTGIAAARELARIRKAQGDLPAAHAALHAALAIADGDKLRLREREVRLDLAELPPPPGGSPDDRLQHAQRARTIAQDAAFPVDEAEAMLVLAELHLEAGAGRRARALFDQAIWIVDRIGPAAVRERAARVRAKLDAAR